MSHRRAKQKRKVLPSRLGLDRAEKLLASFLDAWGNATFLSMVEIFINSEEMEPENLYRYKVRAEFLKGYVLKALRQGLKRRPSST